MIVVVVSGGPLEHYLILMGHEYEIYIHNLLIYSPLCFSSGIVSKPKDHPLNSITINYEKEYHYKADTHGKGRHARLTDEMQVNELLDNYYYKCCCCCCPSGGGGILPLAPPRPPSTVKPEMSVSSNYTALLRLLLRSVSVPVCFAKHLLNKAMQPTCVIYD